MEITIHTNADNLNTDAAITSEERIAYAQRVIEVIRSAYPQASVAHEFGLQSFVEIRDCEGFQESDVVRACEGMVRRVVEAGEFWN